jgi:Ion channel
MLSTSKIVQHIVLVFLLFLTINFIVAGMFSRMEELNYTDAFYLSMSTSTLAGYGNANANSTGGKWFVCFFQLLGAGMWPKYAIQTRSGRKELKN